MQRILRHDNTTSHCSFISAWTRLLPRGGSDFLNNVLKPFDRPRSKRRGQLFLCLPSDVSCCENTSKEWIYSTQLLLFRLGWNIIVPSLSSIDPGYELVYTDHEYLCWIEVWTVTHIRICWVQRFPCVFIYFPRLLECGTELFQFSILYIR